MSVIFFLNASYHIYPNANIGQSGMLYGQSGSQGVVQVIATSTIDSSISDTFDLFINYIPVTNIIIQRCNVC